MTTDSHYGGGGAGVRVWLEDVNCEGGESDIGECVTMGDWGGVSTDCEDHSRDAGVICAGTYLPLTLHHLYPVLVPHSSPITPHLTPHLSLLTHHPHLSLLTYHSSPITPLLSLLT